MISSLKMLQFLLKTGPSRLFPTSYFLMRNVSLPLWMHIQHMSWLFYLVNVPFENLKYKKMKIFITKSVYTIVNKQEEVNFHTLIFSKVSLHTMSFCQAGRTAARPPKKQKWIFKKKFSFVHCISYCKELNSALWLILLLGNTPYL